MASDESAKVLHKKYYGKMMLFRDTRRGFLHLVQGEARENDEILLEHYRLAKGYA